MFPIAGKAMQTQSLGKLQFVSLASAESCSSNLTVLLLCVFGCAVLSLRRYIYLFPNLGKLENSYQID